MLTVKPSTRLIIYVASFEAFAIALSTLFLMLLVGASAEDSFPIAVMVSVAALIWNYLFNLVFAAWEKHRNIRIRTLKIRLLHTAGFEVGLIVICLPIFMIWYQVGLWPAFLLELPLLLFFLIFTFIFTLLFDQLFALPQHQAPPKQA